jgi:hypothetical protein
VARSRRRITAEIVRAKREGKGRRKEWQPRGELIPPNKVHVPKTSYSRKRINNWKDFLDLESLEDEEELS